MGCETPPPIVETRFLYPSLPRLDCAGEPAPPQAVADDAALVDYFETVRLAGAECRDRLAAMRDVTAAWPRQAP